MAEKVFGNQDEDYTSPGELKALNPSLTLRTTKTIQTKFFVLKKTIPNR